MTTIATATAARTSALPPIRRLLSCGVAAGPLYVLVAAAQVLTREGFDIRIHAVSLLSNGHLGWIQITSFVAAGVLTMAGAVGLGRALHGRGATWGPRLLGVYGASLVAAGAFVADPAFGFPVGTPDGAPAEISWHGLGHFAAGGVGFVALIAACMVLGSRFAEEGRPAWAWASRMTGVLFLAAFAGIASGNQLPVLNIAFTAAVVLAWTWVSAVCAQAMDAAPESAR